MYLSDFIVLKPAVDKRSLIDIVQKAVAFAVIVILHDRQFGLEIMTDINDLRWIGVDQTVRRLYGTQT